VTFIGNYKYIEFVVVFETTLFHFITLHSSELDYYVICLVDYLYL
jgi:hypothetical protein